MSRAGRIWRWLTVIALVALVVLGTGRSASAHADLVNTSPTAGAVLEISPAEIVLTFTEPVDPAADAIRLLTPAGTPVELGPVGPGPRSNSLAAAIVGELAGGSYVVAWSAVSVDSHPIRSAFVFSVGTPSDVAADLVAGALGGEGTEQRGTTWLMAGRFASYTGLALLAGSLGAALILAPSALPGRRIGSGALAGGGLAVAGTVTMISVQANAIGTSITDWSAIADTRSGRWWVVRLVLVAVLTGLVPWRRFLDRAPVRIAGAVTALAAFAVVAAGGHATSGRWVGAAITTTVVHLAAMALWLGGIIVIAFAVDRTAMVATAARFSPMAMSSVAVLAATGVFNAWRQIGEPTGLTDSTYGRWLLAKLAVVIVVVIAGAAARRVVHHAGVPVSSTPPGSVGLRAGSRPDRDPLLRRAVRVELVGMVVILAVTGGLAGATPLDETGAAVGRNASVSVVRGDRVAQIDLLPAVTGGTVMHVTITSPAGALGRADEITVAAELTQPQLGPIEIATVPAGPNHVTTTSADFPIAGTWRVRVTARYGEFDQVEFSADIAVVNR